jgi:uncharacterized protein (DUF4415 family)
MGKRKGGAPGARRSREGRNRHEREKGGFPGAGEDGREVEGEEIGVRKGIAPEPLKVGARQNKEEMGRGRGIPSEPPVAGAKQNREEIGKGRGIPLEPLRLGAKQTDEGVKTDAGVRQDREEMGRGRGIPPEPPGAGAKQNREEIGKGRGIPPETLVAGVKPTDEGVKLPRPSAKTDVGAPSAALLPPPADLLRKEPKVKVTITLNAATVDFFKRHAGENGVKYQTMINELLDRYMRLF